MEKLARIFITFFIVLAFITIALPHLAAADSTPLMTGRNTNMRGVSTNIGEVSVWNDLTYLYVTYKISAPGWRMTKTHLHVATSLDDIPQTNKGNPVLGRFHYKGLFENGSGVEYMYKISLAGFNGSPLYIAAHASVRNGETHENEDAWGAGEEFPGSKWATYFTYTIKTVIPR
jgi:hypothetical protein